MKPVKVLFLDGKERNIVKAVKTKRGVELIDTLGEHLPIEKALSYRKETR